MEVSSEGPLRRKAQHRTRRVGEGRRTARRAQGGQRAIIGEDCQQRQHEDKGAEEAGGINHGWEDNAEGFSTESGGHAGREKKSEGFKDRIHLKS